MCLTACIVYNESRPRSPLVYQHARLKVGIASFSLGVLILSVLIFLFYSYLVEPLWSVYPVNSNILIQIQIYLLITLLFSTIVIFISVVTFRFFICAVMGATVISVVAPLLSMLFLVHLFFKFHLFYFLACKLTCEASILFFYFYQGYDVMISDHIEESDY